MPSFSVCELWPNSSLNADVPQAGLRPRMARPVTSSVTPHTKPGVSFKCQ